MLDVKWSGTHQGNTLHLWPYNGTNAQIFYMQRDGTIKSSLSELVLDVRGGVIDGADLIMYNKHGGANQTWKYDKYTQSLKLQSEELQINTRNDVGEQGTDIIASSQRGTFSEWIIVPFSDVERWKDANWSRKDWRNKKQFNVKLLNKNGDGKLVFNMKFN